MLNPRDETDLVEAIRTASGPLAIQGGGTRPVGPPLNADALSVSNLSGISLYEPGALTLVAEAGTPLEEIEKALARENQMLAFEPMDHRPLLGTSGVPTIGGVVAANISGPRRVQAGACRDFLLGVKFVDGTGALVRNGGRVMKNVTGYDLARLMAGSRGTLGVLSEVAFKVLPRPQSVAVLLLSGLSVAQAIKSMSSALTSPFEVSGAAHVPKGLDGDPVTMLRLEGFESSVVYRAEQLKARLAEFAPADIERRIDGEFSTTSGWAWLRNVEAFADKSAVWRLSTNASHVAKLLEEQIGDHVDAILDWGGGLIWIGADDEQLDDIGTDTLDGAKMLHGAFRDHVSKFGGHATLVKGSDELRRAVTVFEPEPEPLAKLAIGLRKRFDPKGILNPGLMG